MGAVCPLRIAMRLRPSHVPQLADQTDQITRYRDRDARSAHAATNNRSSVKVLASEQISLRGSAMKSTDLKPWQVERLQSNLGPAGYARG